MDTYTATETSRVEFFALDARVLASGAVAMLDHAGRVLRLISGPEADDILDRLDDDGPPELACIVCDGLGHAYPIGREYFTNGDSRIITGGGSCPLEG